MDVAALITWIVTAGGGFVMLGIWLRNRNRSLATAGGQGAAGTAPSRLPTPVIFGHFLLAALGLVLWIIYLVSDSRGLAWTSFVLLLVVALGGFFMLSRWIAGGGHRHEATASGQPPENKFPLAVVVGHGLFAATTLVLVLIAAIQAGGS